MVTPLLITPSSPTPPQLTNLRLSFLDQLSPPTYIHIILYFHPIHRPHTSDDLKRSLSHALSIYYPLAGRLRDNSWIHCNDAGAEYIEARFKYARVSDVVEKSQPEELKQYVPATPAGGTDVPLAVQVNFFGCGGIAIGVCMAHRLADAMSMVMFVNTWAAACRGDTKTLDVTHPSFGSAARFPPADFSRFYNPGPPPPPPPENIVTKRFLFDQRKVSALRKAAAGPLMANPTKVEAVSAFLWRHFIESAELKHGGGNKNTVFAATHVVDIRHRANPPLPHQYFGNACARAMAMAEGARNGQDGYYNLAMKLRDKIGKADTGYVTRLENGEDFLKYYSVNEENDPKFKDGRKTLQICSFTSWYRLPAYEVDYGWGKPTWVSVIGVPLKNLIFFLGTKCGEGIEAWVNMAEEDMVAIETNYNLLQQVAGTEQQHKCP